MTATERTLLTRDAVGLVLGLKPRSLDALRRRSTRSGVRFPEPAVEFSKSPAWDAAEVREYAEAVRRPADFAALEAALQVDPSLALRIRVEGVTTGSLTLVLG